MLLCHFSTMMIHHHGSIRNQKHSGFLPNRTHQRSFHSKCRRHPCRFLRHGRSRTCPLVIQFFRRHLCSTKLHYRHQHPMKTFYFRPLPSTRLHHSKLHRLQKLRTFHLWQSVGGLAHFISRILYRSVGDPMRCIPRLLSDHSASTASVACRCPACLASISKASKQTTRPFGSERETASTCSSSGNVNSFGEKL